MVRSLCFLLVLSTSSVLQVNGDGHATNATTATNPTDNLVQVAEKNEFKILVAAVKAAGLADALAGEGPFTIMAPNDAAFEAAFKALGITAEEALENPALGDILKYHAVSGKVMAADVKDGMEVETLQGEKFTVNMKDGKATITGGDILPAANVIGTDVMASNGVVHVIDMVLIPPTISKALKEAAAPPAEPDTTTSAPASDADADHAARSPMPAMGLLLGMFGLLSVSAVAMRA